MTVKGQFRTSTMKREHSRRTRPNNTNSLPSVVRHYRRTRGIAESDANLKIRNISKSHKGFVSKLSAFSRCTIRPILVPWWPSIGEMLVAAR